MFGPCKRLDYELELGYIIGTGNQLGQAMLWLGVVAVNAFVAIFQQFRAQKKLEALEKLFKK